MNRKTTLIAAAFAAAGLTMPMLAQQSQQDFEWYGAGWQDSDYNQQQDQQNQQDWNRRQRSGSPYYNEAEGSRAGSMMYGTDVSEDYEPAADWSQDQRQNRYGQQRNQRQQSGQQQDRQYGQQQGQKQVTGRVQSYRTVSLDGEDQDHVVAKVKTQDGRTAVLDLGKVGDLAIQRTRLDKGMRISASGQSGRINDRSVIVVDNVDIEGQRPRTSYRRQHDRQRQQDQQYGWQQDQQGQQQYGQQYAMPRQQQDRQNQQSRWQQDQQQRQQQQGLTRVRGAQGFDAQNQLAYIQGRITDMTDVSLQGVPDQHRLVKVQIGQNQTVVADLGTREQFEQLNLQAGDTVFIYGNPVRVNDRPVLLASHVAELKGDIIKIDQQHRATKPDVQARSGQQQSQQY